MAAAEKVCGGYRPAAKDSDGLLEEVFVMDPGMWQNDLSGPGSGIKDWWAVGNHDGIIAYFCDEADAFRFRLDYINRLLNP